MKNGTIKTYYDDEKTKIHTEFNFNNGEREGISKTYYENGIIETVSNYKNDNNNGESESYYENGNIKNKKIILWIV